MKHDGTAELLAYWNRIRGKRPAPEQAEIEPGAIARQLPDIFILELPVDSDARFRLAGTRLCTVYGGELKNASFLSLWKAEDRTGIRQILQMVFEDKRAAIIEQEGKSQSGRSAAFETLLLPLADSRLIGSMAAVDPAYWLGADRITENTARAIDLIDPRRELQVALKAAAGAGAPSVYLQEPVHFTGPAVSRRFRHLTVLNGGKS
ncbi:PAS domain-containing protein [Brucella endophytica]|uniref:PAS domain-containing protein n=1 Tax=Brucella endophytica TaxID=1963359 RepID=A0A916WAM2_9HYPH|nr:PAS domain-containing protein [Brucella endophytica]GGA80525.1 PAS domain-containing protein [Brucella endophytica]